MAKNQSDEKLIKACKEYKYDDVVDALKKGAKVNCVDDKQMTPLHHAIPRFRMCKDSSVTFPATFDNVSIVRYLLEKGGNPLAKDKDGDSPLSMARSNYKKICEQGLTQWDNEYNGQILEILEVAEKKLNPKEPNKNLNNPNATGLNNRQDIKK